MALGVKHNLYRVDVLRHGYVIVDAQDEDDAKKAALRCQGVLQVATNPPPTLVEERWKE